MISSISFSGIIKPQTSCQCKSVSPLFTKEKDSFEVNPLYKTISHARNKIIEVLKQDNKEYGFTIAKDGRILEESNGNEHSCSIDARKVEPDSILIHGHPEPLPLSSGDVAILLATDAKSMEAVTVDGKYSRLTKKNPEKSNKDYPQLYLDLEKQLNLKALDELGIDYKVNKQDLIEMFKDYVKEYFFLTEETALEHASHFGMDFQNDDIENIQNKLNKLMAYQLSLNRHKYDKAHNTIIKYNDGINNYLNSPEGIEVRHKFLKDIASEYDLIYETDLFDE